MQGSLKRPKPAKPTSSVARVDRSAGGPSSPYVHTDQAEEALVAETEKMLKLVKGNDLRDAALIASAQKLEHYEMAAYGTAAALAGQLELRDDQRMLHESLEEERQTDALLTTLAKGEVNQDALLTA